MNKSHRPDPGVTWVSGVYLLVGIGYVKYHSGHRQQTTVVWTERVPRLRADLTENDVLKCWGEKTLKSVPDSRVKQRNCAMN